MNATAQPFVIYDKVKSNRTRLLRPITEFLNGFTSRTALAQDMNNFTNKDGKKGRVSITSIDLGRACGTFGTEISEVKIMAIVKYLTENNKEFGETEDVKTISEYYKFTDGLNQVIAARDNTSRENFASSVGCRVEEIEDAEKGRFITKELFESYRSNLKNRCIELKSKSKFKNVQ
jgi:hypothetical protein